MKVLRPADTQLIDSDRFRVAQVDAAVRLVPFSAISSAATILVVVASFWPGGHHAYLSFLLIAIDGAAAAILVGCRRWNAATSRASAAPFALKTAVAAGGTLGILWASLPILLFSTASVHNQLLVTGTVTGLICTGVVVAPVMRAALAFMLPIIAGSFLALAETGDIFFLYIGALLTFYGIFVCFSVIYLSSLFQERMAEQIQIEEQADTIRLLLWDFERTASDWLWQTDAQGRLQHVSERFAGALGMKPEHLTHMSFLETLQNLQYDGERSKTDGLMRLAQCMGAREHFRNWVVQGLSGGKRHWWSFTGAPTFNETGQFLGYRGVGSDVTIAREREEKIAHLASHDSLTGLPNRRSFEEALLLDLEGVEKHGRRFVLLCLDLDGFKTVNDTFGHPMGDALLLAVAGRLRSSVRNEDRIARVGGDEFAVLHRGGDADSAVALARRIIENLSAPYKIDNIDLEIGVSIGLAAAPENGTNMNELIKNADRALYNAKLSGRRVFQFSGTS